jgi:uncharacterized protein YcfJ
MGGAKVNVVGATPVALSERASPRRPARDVTRKFKRDAESGGLGRGVASSRRQARHGGGGGKSAATAHGEVA